MIHLAARGIRAQWEAVAGHLPSLVIGGVEVLHRAPWRGDPAVQSDAALPLVDRRLGGTFACAPFGADDADGGPPHGLAANAPWRVQRSTGAALVATRALTRGRMTARIGLRDGHPVLYQTHMLDLTAPCTFAHHPMIALGQGGRLSTTRPARVLTFAAPTRDGTAFYWPDQSKGGFTLATRTGLHDLRDYPNGPCDDFVTLVHGPGLTWTAIARAAERDTIVTLKRAGQLPTTGLWLSNGGRTDPPWNGRGGVLGIEDGRGVGADGFAAALVGDTALPQPTTFAPGRHVIPHALLRLEGAHLITGLALGTDTLTLRTRQGAQTIPFDPGHFA